MGNTTRILAQRMSLRKPQKDALEDLERITKAIDVRSKDSVEKKLDAILTDGTFTKLKDFDRGFPSFSFAIATGVGKTRLMGAFISYLFMEHKIKNFLVLAPNLTIYNKLIEDFRNSSSDKYVFRGIGDFVHHQPTIITGDDYQSVNTPRRQLNRPGLQQALFSEELEINIFNISKLDKEVSKIKSINELIGEAYYDKLKNLDDLVVIMDESHRYRAERAMQVINELNPILGLELTATPMVSKSGKTTAFKNVAFEYPLANAIRDGLVKEPYVATRKNLDLKVLKKMDEDQLDQMKLDDAIIVHERTKTHLDLYSKDNNLPRVKPFILVVAQNVDHAEKILQHIKSANFYSGQYADKVITVHSKQSGTEKDETVQELLLVEKSDNPIEIVIHVSILKEGWDVRNLFTIVPLRAFAADILTEQTLGRGLRLPYGQKTGNPDVDRLTVIAHDRFNEIIEAAKNPNSIIMKQYIIDRDDPEFNGDHSVITSQSTSDTALDAVKQEITNATTPETKKSAEIKYALKQALIDVVHNDTTTEAIGSVDELSSAKSKKELKEKIVETLPLFDLTPKERDKIVDKILDDGLIEQTLQEVITGMIEIPRLVVQPTGEIKSSFKNFKMNTKQLPNWQPVEESILVKSLQSDDSASIDLIRAKKNPKESLLDGIVRELINRDEIDYEEQAELLFELSQSVVDHLKSVHKDDTKVLNVVLYHAKDIANQIWIQMMDNHIVKESDFIAHGIRPFQKIESHNYSKLKSDDYVDLQTSYKTTTEMRSKVFKGFKKACHNYYKFDVMPEKTFAMVLESDKSVEKWLRPAHNQFIIFYSNQSKRYEPDFVVQTKDVTYLVEIKDKNEIQTAEVQDKAKSALTYCKAVNEHTTNKSRQWKYLLIPDDQVAHNKDFKFFQSFEFNNNA